MWTLEAPLASAPPRWRADLPVIPLVALAAGLGGTAALVATGWMPPEALRVASLVAIHGALLSAALGRAASAGRPQWSPTGPALVTIALLAVALAAAAVDRRGAAAYLSVLIWLALVAQHGRLVRLGLWHPAPLSSILLGVAAGAALGGHLLLCAPLTAGYRLRTDDLGAYLAGVAYDLGVNVVSSELFFRGVVFDVGQRRTSFAFGTSVATAGYVVRYLLDPQLPRTVEVLTGAVVYLALLSVTNCWLFWRSGSVVPGAAGALVFFAAYRALVLP